MYTRYIWQVAVVCGAIFFVMPLFSWFDLVTRCENPEDILLRYQIDKINKLGDVDTIFVGDSSLGNAVDAELFSKLSGKRCVNLALTGFHGYTGTYNIIRRVSRRWKIKNVVVVQTLDMMRRAPSYQGYIYTAELGDLFNLTDFSKNELKSYVEEFVKIFFNSQAIKNLLYRSIHHISKVDWLENDYIRQGQRKKLDPEKVVGFSPASIDQKNISFLKMILAYCSQRDINLVYMHGPSLDILARNSIDYLKNIDAFISSTGIHIIHDLVILPSDMMGDNFFDHVAPEEKAYVTNRYLERLMPVLK